MKKYKDIKYTSDFTVKTGKSEYTFQLKKPNYWWVWILGLIAFLLLCCVRCNHDITVKPVDAVSGDVLACDSITISYASHYLYKNGRFLVTELHQETKVPDNEGEAHFTGLPCSVFGYVFHPFSDASIEVQSGCYDLSENPEYFNFHYTWSKTLKLTPKTEDVALMVVDRETKDPLSEATLQYSYIKSGQEIKDSVKTDASGKCMIEGVALCGDIKVLLASCYAYNDTANVVISVQEAIADPETSTIALTPLKESFVYYVKNKFTKEPIPGASVEITLKNKNNVVRHKAPSTNVDGKGRGAYEDAFIGATLEIRASKINYKDSIYTPICTVQEFIGKPDSLRVIYLEPLPFMQNFVNADSISHKPIPGVMNHIVVNSIDGKEYKYDESSNRNGIFSFLVKEGDKITIDSECKPSYNSKHTVIDKFEKPDTIFMRPETVDLTCRTIIAGTQNLLPDCNLYIFDSNDNNYKPDNSGNGEFIVKRLPLDAELSIIATKDRYGENDYTISNALVLNLLKAAQSERDIPLIEGLEPCNASNSGASDVKAGTVSSPQSYNMGQKSGTFDISWKNGGSCPDQIDVYNHESGEAYNSRSPIFTTGMTEGDGSSSVNFSNGSVITIVVTTGPKDGSSWEYNIGCPK